MQSLPSYPPALPGADQQSYIGHAWQLNNLLRPICRLKRVFAIEIETCPLCGGKLRVIACIEEPWLIAKILGHVRARDAAAGTEARAPPGHGEETLQLI